MNEKTVFEKIIDREIPADIVYEDDISMAFLDINPVAKGHTLLISKYPYPWMTDVPPELLGELFIRAQKIMTNLLSTTGAQVIQVVVDGKEVSHFHIHLIPRQIGEHSTDFSKISYSDDTEKQKYVTTIQSTLY